jgi:hypothetical protein
MHFSGNAQDHKTCIRKGWLVWAGLAVMLLAGAAAGQTCMAGDEIDAATRTTLENAAKQYYDWTLKGDSASIKQNSIPSVAADFGGIESAMKDGQTQFAGAQATVRPPFLLHAEGSESSARVEFLCGVFGKAGQTSNSAVFVIPNLPPGDYAVTIMDVAAKNPWTLSLVLQKMGNAWKLGGYYARPTEAGGHNGAWFRDKAREFKAKGENHNAWMYYLEARSLMAPVPFMSTQETDRMYDESQALQPTDAPSSDAPVELSANGKTYRVTSMFPIGVADDIDLVVKYQCASVSNTAQTYQDNLAAIRALVAKYPEYRNGFTSIIARAVEPSGRDYGTMLAVKDIK